MDPVSIAGAANGVAKLAVSCTSTLYSFISDHKNVDGNIRALYDEVDGLKQTAKSVESMLERPDLHAYNDLQLWTDADAALKASDGSLRRLENQLRGVDTVERRGTSFFSRGVAQIKLNMKDEDIIKVRCQLHSHRLALQLIVQLIGVHVSAAGPAIILAEVVPQLTMLVSMLQAHNQNTRNRSSIDNLDDNESGILRSNDRLAQTAHELVVELASMANQDG